MSVSGGSRYVVGIDLGTTNSVCSYIDTTANGPAEFLGITQRISEQDWAARVVLPSFLYLPGAHELPPGSLSLPWDTPDYLVGEFARVQGARVPGRLVSSAKSWLCHPYVERTAAILPWDALADVSKVSPVEASARYLAHMRDSWNHEMGHPLQVQDLVITVPASFNEIARELTVAAAHQAGLERFRLLEEPQAAYYSWIASREKTWAKELKGVRRVLICDVGGGTTDFTMIEVKPGRPKPKLVRVAVGDHLMLGGDNMDLALAHHLEAVMTAREDGTSIRLDARQWGILLQECRTAKERLLGTDGPHELTVTIPGTGSRLLSGMLQATLTRDDATRLVLDGFFPQTDKTDLPLRGRRAGLTEVGLPYVTDPAVPRHLAAFIAQHGGEPPDGVLFNGAALTPPAVRQRLLDVLGRWRGEPVTELPNPWLDKAVAHGAAYFGLVLRGRGVRIGGGTGRAYYMKVEEEQNICLVSADMGEGDEATVREPEMVLKLGQPVSFPVVCSALRTADRPGDVVRFGADEPIDALPPLRTVLKGEGETSIELQSRVSEIGTLELYCVRRDGAGQWRLQFDMRGEPLAEGIELPVRRESLAQAREQVVRVFQTKPSKLGDVKPRNLLSTLEDHLKLRREEWPTPILREIWEALDRVRKRRRSTDQYEAAWFNAAGFCMRPGFGYPLDEWRMDRLWDVFSHWLQWFKETPVRMEWWVMWRRVAAGLKDEQQARLFADVSPLLLPGRKHLKMFTRPHPTNAELAEIWRMVASLEKLPVADRTQLGALALERAQKRGSTVQDFWVLARLGARHPFGASLHYALPPGAVTPWVETLIESAWADRHAAGFALAQMARCTGDRVRDLEDGVRHRVAARMQQESVDEDLVRRVLQPVAVEAREQVQMLGDSLPVGLRLAKG
ncbi:MAG TPA: Hsp70 family protein [Candidatus Xenobia bacterium]